MQLINLLDQTMPGITKILELKSRKPEKCALLLFIKRFKSFDEKTAGLHKSDLIIVAARPGMGKTAFALNIAEQCAIKAGASVLIFSLEMSQEQLGQRLIAMQARVESEKLKKGELDRKDWDRINVALNELNGTKIASKNEVVIKDADVSELNLSEFEGKVTFINCCGFEKRCALLNFDIRFKFCDFI